MIKNVIFDLGNVLVPIDYDATYNALDKLSNQAEGNSEKFDELYYKYETGQISTSLFLNGVLRLAKRDVQALDVIEAWNAMLLDVPAQSLELIEQTRKNHNVFILSNTNDLHIQWVNKQMKKKYKLNSFDEIVDRAFYSHKLKMKKPEDRIYTQVLADAELEPAATLFLDDIEENIQAARKTGIKAEQVKAFAEAKETLEKALAKYQK